MYFILCTIYTYNIQAWRELGLIVIVVAITMLMFSTLLFAFESDGPAPEVATFFVSTQRNISIIQKFLGSDIVCDCVSKVWGFLDCIWWSLMTLTTVGFHLQPQASPA